MPSALLRRAVVAVGLVGAVAWSAGPVFAAGPGDALPTSGTALTGAVVVAPGGASTGYATKVVVVTQGSSLAFANLDQLPHTVTSTARTKSGDPLFSTSAGPTTTAQVSGVSKLAPGSYDFLCQF